MWKTSAPGSAWLLPKKSWLEEQSVLMVPFSSCLGRLPMTSSPELLYERLMGRISPSQSNWCRWSRVATKSGCSTSSSVMSSELLSWRRSDETTTTPRPPFPYHSTSESKCIFIALRWQLFLLLIGCLLVETEALNLFTPRAYRLQGEEGM